MRICFERVELHNFMSFAEESFDFTACTGMNLVQGKNNDVSGSNGCGKSTMFASLAYALFGQMQDNDMKNKNIASRFSSSKNMDVVLTFSVDEKHYKIRRGLVKGNSSYLELYEVKDGKESSITRSTIAETQKFIEECLIKLDQMMFFRTILLTADQTYNFYKMKKADKKEFVEKLFDISLFEDMYKLLHKDILSLNKDMNTSQAKLLVMNKNIEEYSSKLDSYESTKKAQLDAMIAEVKPVKQRLDEAKKTQAMIDSNEAANIESEVDALMQQREEAMSSKSKIEREIGAIDVELHKLEASCNASNAVISKHKDVMSKLCSKCKPVFIKHYNLDEYAKTIRDAKSKMAKLDEERKQAASRLEECESKVPGIKAKIADAKSKLQEARAKADNASRAVMLLESQMKSKVDAIKRLRDEANPYTSLVDKCNNDISHETKKVSSIEASMKYLSFAESIVSQETIRKFIIKDLVVLLNNKVKTYLTKLGANYYVKFDEDMDYEFVTPTGTCEWGNFSAGEKTRIMIATSFAFRDFMSIRNGLSSSILVLDEYFDSAIDSICIESILALLNDFSKSQHQDIFIITHRQEVSPDTFDRTLLVEKTNNMSTIKVI